jgi:hypothetical protein
MVITGSNKLKGNLGKGVFPFRSEIMSVGKFLLLSDEILEPRFYSSFIVKSLLRSAFSAY